MRAVIVLIIALFVSGCGGGGGGGGSDAPAPAPPPAGPSAANDQASVDEESSVTIDVTANDSQVDGSTLSVASNPANGVAEIDGTTIVYSPNVDFAGTDSFTYGVTGDNGTGLTAAVTVTVKNINDAPVAQPDSFTLVENNILPLTLAGNDSDIDSAIVSFEIIGTITGQITGTGTDLSYLPPLDFVGTESFTYRAMDEEGATSNEAAVTITVEPVTVTMLEVVQLSVPSSGYSAVNDSELGASVLSSTAQEITVPPNVVSVLLALNGADANIDENGLFISSLVPPSGPFAGFQRFVNFCFDGNCSSLVPRLPAYVAESGTWTFQLGTLAGTLDDIDFADLTVTAIFRTGPAPDTSDTGSTTIVVKPFLTADSINAAELEPALTRLVELGAQNRIEFVIEPVTLVEETEFTSVSASFLDATTISLVSKGDADSVNLFFLEDFLAGESLAGISGGVPGSFGTKNGNNGVLINAGTLLADGSEASIQDTAETTFHEMGHLLGLYHTTEARFSFIDVLDDTPFCEESVHDANNDGVANATECPDAANPMFWFNSVLIEPTELTDDQKHVVFYSPIAVPGSL